MDASEPVLADHPRRPELLAAKVKRPAMARGGRHGFRVTLARVAFACMAERAHPSVTA